MFRILLVISFIFVGALQGIAIGNVDLAEFETSSVEIQTLVEIETSQTDCCEDSRIIDNIPTFCKLDCKALLPLGLLAVGDAAKKHEWNLADAHNSIASLVDLGPPKS